MSVRFFPHRAAVMEPSGPPPPPDIPDTPDGPGDFPSDPAPHEPNEIDLGEVRVRSQSAANETSLV